MRTPFVPRAVRIPPRGAWQPIVLFALPLLLAACADPPGGDPREDSPDTDAATDGGVVRIDFQPDERDGEPTPLNDARVDDDATPGPDPDAAITPPLDMAIGPVRGDAAPGEACDDDLDCADGDCLPAPDYPGGYCAIIGCGGEVSCAPGTRCVQGVGGSFCAVECSGADCREGYACADYDGAPVCIPGQEEGRPDGMPCERDGQCAGGACITDWPGGYCTTVGCESRVDCARGEGDAIDNRCYVANDPTFCIRMCQQPTDCRAGYICQPAGQGLGICFPDPSQPVLPPDEIADSPLNITCQGPSGQGSYTLGFDVAGTTSAYMVVPFTLDGQRLDPIRIDRPSGQRIDFRGTNSFQTAGAALFGGINPTTVPAARQYQNQLEAGRHGYVLASNTAQMCWYQLEEDRDGTTIDLNIYLVGLPITAAQAAGDRNMQALLDAFESIYQSAGVSLGQMRFVDIVGQDAQTFGTLRSQEAVGQVLELTTPPGPTLDDHLSLNVVFIRGFAIPGAAGVLGISQGLPGPAGLHGSQASGVVFTGEYLGQRLQDGSGAVIDGNLYTGIVMAHEVGHYLGLFHTTEQNQRSTDPLPDTPTCTRGQNFPLGCPDWQNLMFPLAGPDHTDVTEDQRSVIRHNPLTKD